MPRRDDLSTILIIGSGPIVIGQGCEFDYAGTQACRALREDGYNIVLVNSNPATIMTDPGLADRTYIEPITPEVLTRIMEAEQEGSFAIDALLPTMGGQTALNCACRLHDDCVLTRFGVEMIGATRSVIERAENRMKFNDIVRRLGLETARYASASSMETALEAMESIGLPVIVRPAFTLGGGGGGKADSRDEFIEIVRRGLRESMTGEVLIDEALLGWKEFELEVVRDRNDNCIVVCGIENLDPMGVHTGDSITVAPIMTLSDKEYQRMRDAALAIMRAVGVETGGSNVQFAVNPEDGRMVVVEMNPRVSRSSALASKATGLPIARIAAHLAVGYTLDELGNTITGTTSACFEPSIDYVVTKMPRWTFEKFPEADETLTTQMKSVGEAMAIGRTFAESLQKAIRSMEVQRFGLGLDAHDGWLAVRRGRGDEADWPVPESRLIRKLTVPGQGRLHHIRDALRMGWTAERVGELSGIDPWFIDQIARLVEFEDVLCEYERLEDVPRAILFRAKQLGYSDPQLANLYLGEITRESILKARQHRKSLGIEPVFKLVDTCAAEFEAVTPYYYATYEQPCRTDAGSTRSDDELVPSATEKVVIIGGGPNRIGQGIEFDYCCVQAVFAAREMGFETVMINSNPETVSTDSDMSDLLFFEPLTLEDVLNVVDRLQADAGALRGVIVQFGGQTPLNLAGGLQAAGVPILGTTPQDIRRAEDRDVFDAVLDELKLSRPPSGMAGDLAGAKRIAADLGYPVMVRPSYVLGGRGMEICAVEADLDRFMAEALRATDRTRRDEVDAVHILVDKFLRNATEVDVDCIADFDAAGEGSCVICGVLEHIEEAGIHSGDSACAFPPWSLSPLVIHQLHDHTTRLARATRTRGLMNVQYAIRGGLVSVLEVNPRASRTVPFISKATGVSWAKAAARIMLGESVKEVAVALEIDRAAHASHICVKQSVFPFARFPGVDARLGPEMRSTGEVMGIDRSFGLAFAKAQMAAGASLPASGDILLSVNDDDKPYVVPIGAAFAEMGFRIFATVGTRNVLAESGVDAILVSKSAGDDAPWLMDLISSGALGLLINTPLYLGSRFEEGKWRAAAITRGVPLITTLTGAVAAAEALQALRAGTWSVQSLQAYYGSSGNDLPGNGGPHRAGGR